MPKIKKEWGLMLGYQPLMSIKKFSKNNFKVVYSTFTLVKKFY